MQDQLEHAALGQACPEQSFQRGQGFGAGKGQGRAFPEKTQAAILIEVDVKAGLIGQIVQVSGKGVAAGHVVQISLFEVGSGLQAYFLKEGVHGAFSLTSLKIHWACSTSR